MKSSYFITIQLLILLTGLIRPLSTHAEGSSVSALSEAKQAFILCRDAVKSGDLSKISEYTESKMHEFLKKGGIRIMQQSFEMCGGYDAAITDVLDCDKANPSSKSDSTAFIYFESSGFMCPKFFKMKRENEKWVLVDPVHHKGSR